MNDRDLDVITIGRSSVDLYAQQVGTRLEDVQTFNKSVGGCPSNIAIRCARMGLRSAIIAGIGDDADGSWLCDGSQYIWCGSAQMAGGNHDRC